MKVNLNHIKSFDRAASQYDQVNVIASEVGDRLLERLQVFNLKPRILIDLGAGTGHFLPSLNKTYRSANIIAVDLSVHMLERARKKIPWYKSKKCVCATADVLPFEQNSIDLIFSNLVFHWCDDLHILFAELYRILRPGGLLMFTMYGPDTLMELRQAWSEVDNYSHINTQVDLHDVGDLLLRAGFSDPVLDQDKITLQYNNVPPIFSDLKALGTHNLTKHPCPGLWGRGRMTQLIEAYQRFRQPNGKLPVTYEIIYGQGWKSERAEKNRREDNEIHIPISQISRS